MIAFEYRTPKNLKEVHKNLKDFGSDGKLVAGGTALIIMMKQRLVRPSCLISLRKVSGLNRITLKKNGLAIGGLVTHRELETSPLVRRRVPLLADTYRHVATIRVRNMATVGGGLAHADPNQDPPPTLIALGATAKATSAKGSRVIPMEDFFSDYYETVLQPEEILTEINVPSLPTGSAGAFLKFLPRTADDYATVSAAAVVTLDRSRKTFKDVRIALGSVGPTAIRAQEAEDILRGQPVKAEALREAGEKAKLAVDPISDFRGSAAYKKEMAGVFVRRALEKALAGISKGPAAKAKTTRTKAKPKPKKKTKTRTKTKPKARAGRKTAARGRRR
ncbi:MAG: xanthine dehydrogenase family protein subunit M [Candidatus Binatia bacterium]|jgi:carbon-monoxide dehydrogenase medium subunit|nr:xanthine dehydrogenase family protein subunit M [Candidatus Binatia bacterium]